MSEKWKCCQNMKEQAKEKENPTTEGLLQGTEKDSRWESMSTVCSGVQ